MMCKMTSRLLQTLLSLTLCGMMCFCVVDAQDHHSMSSNMTMGSNTTTTDNSMMNHGDMMNSTSTPANSTMHHGMVSNSTSGGTMHHGGMGSTAATGMMDHGSMQGSNITSGGHGAMPPGETSGSMNHGGVHGGTANTVNTGAGHGAGHNMDPGTTASDAAAGGGHGAGHGAAGSTSTSGHYGFFHVTFNTVILFEQWVTSTWQGLLGSCIGILVATILYEGLKVFRSYLLKKLKSTKDIKPSIAQKICSCSHVVQTLLHVVQMVSSYLLMLVFMTFNLWLCLSVIIGFGLGYFIFRWDQGHESMDTNDHCM